MLNESEVKCNGPPPYLSLVPTADDVKELAKALAHLK